MTRLPMGYDNLNANLKKSTAAGIKALKCVISQRKFQERSRRFF